MWSEGTISAPETGNIYKYWVKHYETGSQFVIDEGKVSKCTIRKAGESRDLYNFDRGLDVDCQSDEVRTGLSIILAKYN